MTSSCSVPGLDIFRSVFADESTYPAQNKARDSTHQTESPYFVSAWTTATSYLEQLLGSSQSISTPYPVAVQDAIRWLAGNKDSSTSLSGHQALIKWYTAFTRAHFTEHLLKQLEQDIFDARPDETLETVVRTLEDALSVYFRGLDVIVRDQDRSSSEHITRIFRQDIHVIIEKAVFPQIKQQLQRILDEKVSIILATPVPENIFGYASEREKTRTNLLKAVGALHNVGLAGEGFQRTFAEVMSTALNKYIVNTFSKQWSTPDLSFSHQDIRDHRRANLKSTNYTTHRRSSAFEDNSILPRTINHTTPSQCVWDLCKWVETTYSELVHEVLSMSDNSPVTDKDIEKWKEMSVDILASLRINELFEIAKQWPNATGALDDLRASVNTTQKRLQLTDTFSIQLEKELLHAGTSTLAILRTYISMIRSFHALDHSKVLLNRVSYSLETYLCTRHDTVKTIIAGLLADIHDGDGVEISDNSESLIELAKLLNEGTEGTEQKIDDYLDWDDMEWQPDPVDAGPGYRRSKSADVIGTLIGVLGSADIFIKEFHTIMGDNLLRNMQDFARERQLLDLLKSRFGGALMQSCDVMIRDISASKTLNEEIREKQSLSYTANAELPSDTRQLQPSVNAKILSRLYWPDFNKDNYRVPSNIAELQARYAQGFENSKHSRKLNWHPILGQAKVELELTDRTIVEECSTWQATVIWAVQEHLSRSNVSTVTVQQIAEQLEMKETMVRAAMKLWTSKTVLKERAVDQYIVLETITQNDLEISEANRSAQAAGAIVSASDNTNIIGGEDMIPDQEMTGLAPEKKALYWQFVFGMLKNGKTQKPLSQIGVTLRALIPESTILDADLKTLLTAKVQEGILELKGSKYKLAKKKAA